MGTACADPGRASWPRVSHKWGGRKGPTLRGRAVIALNEGGNGDSLVFVGPDSLVQKIFA